jgi:hypothetical protein
MEETNSKQSHLKAVVLLLIGFIIGFAAHAFTVTKEEVGETAKEGLAAEETSQPEGSTVSDVETKTVANTSSMSDDVLATANTVTSAEYTMSVADQSAGNVVIVSKTIFKKATWVAVREDVNGKMGNILGAYLFPEGTQSGSVELLRPTEEGSSYYVVAYLDDGDKEFDYKKDTLLTNTDNKAVAAQFKTN